MFHVKMDIDRILRSLADMETEAMLQSVELSRQMAVILSIDTVHAVTVQEFGNFGRPYNPAYGKWKLRKVSHLDFWKLYGDLIANISAFAYGDSWASGIIPGAVNREQKSIEMYAGVNESDSGNRRPLFRKSRERFMDKKWGAMAGHAHGRIVAKWKK